MLGDGEAAEAGKRYFLATGEIVGDRREYRVDRAPGLRLGHNSDAGDAIGNFGSGAQDVFLFQNSLYRPYIQTDRPPRLCAVSTGLLRLSPWNYGRKLMATPPVTAV